MITKLLSLNYAYIENGSVYFKVSQFPSYGQLANLKTDDIETTVQQQQGPNERRGLDEKQDARDFALWKAFNSTSDGDIAWDASFGKGRPGKLQTFFILIVIYSMFHRNLYKSIII